MAPVAVLVLVEDGEVTAPPGSRSSELSLEPAAPASKSPTTVPSVGCSIGLLDLMIRYLVAVPQSQSSPGAVHWSVDAGAARGVASSLVGVPGGRVSVP